MADVLAMFGGSLIGLALGASVVLWKINRRERWEAVVWHAWFEANIAYLAFIRDHPTATTLERLAFICGPDGTGRILNAGEP